MQRAMLLYPLGVIVQIAATVVLCVVGSGAKGLAAAMIPYVLLWPCTGFLDRHGISKILFAVYGLTVSVVQLVNGLGSVPVVQLVFVVTAFAVSTMCLFESMTFAEQFYDYQCVLEDRRRRVEVEMAAQRREASMMRMYAEAAERAERDRAKKQAAALAVPPKAVTYVISSPDDNICLGVADKV
jgi:hypothetical protein